MSAHLLSWFIGFNAWNTLWMYSKRNDLLLNPIKDFNLLSEIVYDAKKLLADVKRMVSDAKEKEKFEIVQPGKKK